MNKRRQNAVPSWHAWSTVSGEMTALGAEAARRQEIPMDDTNADGEGEVLENDSERAECKTCGTAMLRSPECMGGFLSLPIANIASFFFFRLQSIL